MDEVLRQPEAQNQAVFESAFDVIFHLDKDGRLLDINCRAEALTGYSRVQLLGMNVLQDLVIPEDRPVIQQVLHDVAQGRERVYEVRWQAKDGGVIHVDVYDALCSARPYRAAWPEEKVHEHIRSLAGAHFDPAVVEMFLKSHG